MTNQSIINNTHVGIDVSKDNLDVYINLTNQSFQVKNNLEGYKEIVEKINLMVDGSVTVALEATGGYEKNVIRYLQDAKIEVALVNPRKVRDFAKAAGILAKTDVVDAKVIALFSEKLNPKILAIQSEKQAELADLRARRHQLVAMLTQEKNRLGMASDVTRDSIANHIEYLQKELSSIEETLETNITSDPDLAQKQKVLLSFKGIGKTVASTLIADLPELGTVSAKQISALVGLAPYNRDSGKMRGSRCIWGGRASIRRMLYMTAWVAVKHNPIIATFYNRLIEAGKKKMVAITACMHKVLIIINAMVKKNQLWGENITATA